MSFGAMTRTDAGLLDEILSELRWKKAIRFLEIGTHTGGTARGVRNWCAANDTLLDYWGVEAGAICTPTVPFEGANLVIGDSVRVSHLVPGNFDIAYIDGDHGGNHVILDTLLYGQKVREGGYMIFHDTSPEIQQTMPEADGPTEVPWFNNSVNKAHELMGFPSADWTKFKSVYEPGAKIGGMTVYLKLIWREPLA